MYILGATNFINGLTPILHVMLKASRCGSVEVGLSLYKNLYKNGYSAYILVSKNSYAEKTLTELNLPYFVTDLLRDKSNKVFFKQQLYKLIYKICKEKNIGIIHGHKKSEYDVVKNVAKDLKIGSAAFYHLAVEPQYESFAGFNAFMATCPRVVELMRIQNKKLSLGIQYIDFISPPFNEDRIVNFTPHYASSAEFFQKQFGITIKDCPIVCMIANFSSFKNQPLLFEVIHRLTHQKHIAVQLVLAGTGSAERVAQYKRLVKTLKIEERVYFLGYTRLVPDILFYSDIKVLASKSEAFGIVLLEAALMKKPVIILRETGAADFLVVHEKTGLLADQNSVDGLAVQIERLIKNPEERLLFGKNLFDVVCERFTTSASLAKIIEIYYNISRRVSLG
jgi:glycosyltransferase involved in cell wall biosynthesis